MKCYACEGKRGWYDGGPDYELWYWEECHICKGSGQVPFWDWFWETFWEKMPVELVEWYGDILTKRYEEKK